MIFPLHYSIPQHLLNQFHDFYSFLMCYLFLTVKSFYFQLLQVWSATEHEQEEYLDSLWAQISKLRDDGWVERHISRYYVAFDGSLAGAVTHNLPL